ncbi:nitric-oxide reductase [Chitinophagaceae bacterium IBVUCB1]|nr:nitric-oxide reductase [Chitinophagaceae bacterium IBVUCB1]
MFLRYWLLLFIIFVSYTLFLFRHCDTKPIPPTQSAMKGASIWREKNCQSCHQLYGLGGYMGPDLTNIISSKAENNARTFIKYGTGKMPNLHLNDEEVDNLVAYLSWIDKTGKSEVNDSNIHWTGSYIIK